MNPSRCHGLPALLLALLLALPIALGAPVSGAENTTPDTRRAAAELATLLEDTYLFPDIGKRYATHLRARAAEGAYDEVAKAEDLAARLETELNELHEDAHLRIRTNGSDAKSSGQPGRRRLRGIPPGPAISGARWFDEDIAYVAINLLPGDQASQQAMAAFLDEYRAARALILDLRACPGGTLPVMDVLFSRIFSERTHLVTMDTRVESERRNGAVFTDSAALTRESAPDGIVRRYHWAVPASPSSPLADKPVYVLTGSTGSACEHLALALKASDRATLIGTPTMGAGHYGGIQDFGDGRFNAFVPVGRTFDPQTGDDWEGSGVAPHVETPAEDALDHALARLGVEREAPPAIESAESYVGLYGNRRITLDDGTLYLQRIDVQPNGQTSGGRRRIAPKLELRPLGNEEFELPRIPGARVRFERDESGQVVRLAVQQRDGRWEEADRDSGQ